MRSVNSSVRPPAVRESAYVPGSGGVGNEQVIVCGSEAVTVACAAIVPFVSAVLTGMPALPLAVSVKFAALTALAGLVWRVLAGLRSR